MPDQSEPEHLSDLFGALPDPQKDLPRPAEAEPAPGSRRAARAAAGGEAGAPAQPGDDPAPPTLDDLFAQEPEHRAPKKRRRTGCLVALIIVFVLIGGAAAGGLYVWNTYGDRISEFMGWGPAKDYTDGEATGEALVTISQGDDGAAVSTALFRAGVTKTDGVFYAMLLKENSSATFYPGVYRLQQKMTAAAALKAIQDPANKLQNSALVREGLTVTETLKAISEGIGMPLADLQAAVATPAAYGIDAPNLEGWLFPALYEFPDGATANDVIETLVDRTRKALSDAKVPAGQEERILTIASIIQREARAEADFYKVSRVIQNRLAQGMKLQMDSTAQFGYGELHAGSASTSAEAQDNDNPWNTYVIDGLPQTPIAGAGDKAIDAALHPVDGPWIYFVTVNLDTGETVFSVTLEEQDAAITKWREWCKANPDSGC